MTYLKFMRYSSLIYLFCFVVAGCGGGSNESGSENSSNSDNSSEQTSNIDAGNNTSDQANNSDNDPSGSNTNEPKPNIPESFTITTALLGRGTISPVFHQLKILNFKFSLNQVIPLHR